MKSKLFITGILIFWAAIAAPGLVGQVTPPDPDDESNPEKKENPDSLKKKEIKPRTMRVYPGRVEQHVRFRELHNTSIARVPYRDELDRVQGFTQSLGQIGKPYQRYYLGARAEYYKTDVFRNLVTGQEDAYIMNPETDIKYYDSRTPFVNVDYMQGKAELASLEITASQNINPFVNFTLYYHRRQSEGVYLEHVTDHYNAYLSANAHTPDERYIVFAHGGFNELADELHGGVAQLYSAYENFFGKGAATVSLTDARLKKRYRNLYVKQFLRLVNDTMNKPHRLALYSTILRDEQYQQFNDANISSSLAAFQFPVYPTFTTGTIMERGLVRRWVFKEGLSYRFAGSKVLSMNHRIQLNNSRLVLNKEGTETVVNQFEPSAEGNVFFDPTPFSLDVNYDLRQVNTNVFNAGFYGNLEATLGVGKYRFNYAEMLPGYKLGGEDSLSRTVMHRPFSISVAGIVHDRNPTLLNTYWPGYLGNTFSVDPTLRNQNFQHLKAGFSLWGKDKKGNIRVKPGNLLSLSVFTSRVNQMIWYDTTMTLQQGAAGENLTWQGLEAKFRLNFGSFTLENSTILQQPSSSFDSTTSAQFTESQPWLYGKAGFYYENQDLKIASVIRAGIECHYNAGFKGYLFDPMSQQFYPQTQFLMPGYPRIDVVFSTQIKKAYLFIRAINVNEGFPQVGYYSTPFYPMLERTITFGVSWAFFD